MTTATEGGAMAPPLPDLDELPPSPVLLLTRFLDTLTDRKWRDHCPDALCGDGPLSHVVPGPKAYLASNASPYLRYAEVPGGPVDFLRADSTVLGDLTAPPTLFVALPLLVLALRVAKTCLLPAFRRVGRRWAAETHGSEWVHANGERITKFGEYVFRLFYHVAVSIWGLAYFGRKPWFGVFTGNTEHFWLDHPHHPVEPGMAWYYLLQSAYNVEALVNLIELSFEVRWLRTSTGKGKVYHWIPVGIGWAPTVRGDFREMAVHHVVTNALIFFSSAFRFTRIGSMIFLVHDVSDVPVDLSKLANFLKWKTTTVVCFVLMVLTWVITRLGVLPFVIFRSIWTESQSLLSVEPGDGGVHPLMFKAFQPFFCLLVAMIVLLHLVWFLMFVKMGFVLVSRGETHDLSEHKNGERTNEVGDSASDDGRGAKEGGEGECPTAGTARNGSGGGGSADANGTTRRRTYSNGRDAPSPSGSTSGEEEEGDGEFETSARLTTNGNGAAGVANGGGGGAATRMRRKEKLR